jgi:hypothetical protein
MKQAAESKEAICVSREVAGKIQAIGQGKIGQLQV